MAQIDSDVIIIGAGVLGVSLAYHLGALGVRVTVLERESVPAAHASGKNAGMIRQLYHHPQLTEWAARSIALWPESLKSLCFRETGSFILGREIPNHHQDLFSQTKTGVITQTDGLLDAGGFVSGIYGMCEKHKVRFKFNQEVVSIEELKSCFRAVTWDGSVYQAPRLVNCAGAWVNSFLAPTSGIKAQPFARHLFVVHGFPRDFMPEQNCGFYWDESHGWYIRLWDDASRLFSICDRVPATPENFVPNQAVTEDVVHKLMGFFPDIAHSLELGRSWHCFRTYTEDQLPVWGEDPEIRGLFWLAAFGGFGISTGFGAAHDAALQITGKNVSIPAEFLPGRVKKSAPLLTAEANS